MALLIINYHYLKYPNKKILTKRGVDINIFAKQLQILKKYFIPTSFFELKKTSLKNNNYVIITFDDSLKDCVEAAAPVAQKLNFPLSLFLSTLPLSQKRILDVQKIHLLLDKLNIKELAKLFYQELKQYPKIKRQKPPLVQLKDIYKYDTPEIKQFKLDLNYLLPPKLKTKIITKIFTKIYGDEKQIARRLYLNLNEAKYLNKYFEIGGHTYSHPLLTKLTDYEQEQEIKKNRQFLNQITKTSLPFSIPFGARGTFNKTTIKLLKKYNFFNLITMIRGINHRLNNYYLKRFDVNDIFDGPILRNKFKNLSNQKC